MGAPDVPWRDTGVPCGCSRAGVYPVPPSLTGVALSLTGLGHMSFEKRVLWVKRQMERQWLGDLKAPPVL